MSGLSKGVIASKMLFAQGAQQHRQVLLLATAQALFQTASTIVVTIGALAGGRVAPAPQLASAPRA